MGLFAKKIGVNFLKEDSSAEEYINKLKELQGQAAEHSDVSEKLKRQIGLATAGVIGEKKVAFELKNSGMDMFVLHDICLESNGLAAQIDYLVITRKRVYVLECKYISDNVKIDENGVFAKLCTQNGKSFYKTFYSPVTQNERHMRILREVGLADKGNFFSKALFENRFEETYKSVIIFTNEKTYINAKSAPEEITEQVVRADQLISYLNKKDAECKKGEMSEKEMRALAEYFLSQNRQERTDYTQKYSELLEEEEKSGQQTAQREEAQSAQVQEKAGKASSDEMQKQPAQSKETPTEALKAFRLARSREEKIKAYYIFNDAQMQELIDKKPRTREELLAVSGFGEVKTEKYGDEILKILSRF